MKFDLINVFQCESEEQWNEYVDKIIDEYNINAVKINVDGKELEVWFYDDDLSTLFTDFGIGVGITLDFKKKFAFDDDYQPVGLDYGDHIETVELHQNGNIFSCKAYCAHNGVGADYAFALFDIDFI